MSRKCRDVQIVVKHCLERKQSREATFFSSTAGRNFVTNNSGKHFVYIIDIFLFYWEKFLQIFFFFFFFFIPFLLFILPTNSISFFFFLFNYNTYFSHGFSKEYVSYYVAHHYFAHSSLILSLSHLISRLSSSKEMFLVKRDLCRNFIERTWLLLECRSQSVLHAYLFFFFYSLFVIYFAYQLNFDSNF